MENSWIHAFPDVKYLSMWNANSIAQDLNSCCCVHFDYTPNASFVNNYSFKEMFLIIYTHMVLSIFIKYK